MIKDYASSKERLNFKEVNNLKIIIMNDLMMIIAILSIIVIYSLDGALR